MMWMICARRLLSIEELQEAVAFDSPDNSWNADKIPDGDKIIKSCHGLVTRDADDGKIRLAHHTVQQYLVSPRELFPTSDLENFEEMRARARFWPELEEFRRDTSAAGVMAGRLCATYLCFSDFSTAVSRRQHDQNFNLAAAFRDRGPVSIPAALGLGKQLHSLPYRFFGSQKHIKMPEIDYSKYLSIKPRSQRPHPDFRKKFALLEYVIEYWPSHTRDFPWSSEPNLAQKFWNLVQHETVAFEFRPWGSNRHFGPYGCKGCPVPESDDLNPEQLSSMALMHWAAETGHTKVFEIVEPPLQKYLKHERDHDETLLIACRHAQVPVVESLLLSGYLDFSYSGAIIAACISGNVSILKCLFQARDETSVLSYRKANRGFFESPLAIHQAASNGHAGVVEFLLRRGVQLHYKDTATGLTPLQIASQNGQLQAVKVICEHSLRKVSTDRDRDAGHEKTGMTALHFAAAGGHDEVVALLIDHGSRCSDQDARGETALIKASRNGHAITAKVLLERGADPLIRGLMLLFDSPVVQALALHYAAAMGHDNVVAILPYSDWTCENGQNALHIGAKLGHPGVIQLLLSKGADIESKNLAGMTALHIASQEGHSQVVQLLIDKGCKIEAREGRCRTALHYAAITSKAEVVKLLMTNGAALSGDEDGNTALHLAIRNTDADITHTIRIMVECGASLEAENRTYNTALDEAILYDMPANVSALIVHGANWNRYNAFHCAVISDSRRVVELLLSKFSAATIEERRESIKIIQLLLARESQYRNKGPFRMLRGWLAEETSSTA